MTDTQRISGVLSPVVTPFDADLRPDGEKLTRHCRWLLDNDVGLAVFGTNSEANSLSLQEKMSLLSGLIESGIPGARMMPGTGCCSISDSVELTRHAVNLGCAGTLMLPPFYYKGVSDEGLFRNYSEIIQRVGDSRLRIYLYHIPPVAQVPISIGLIERLLKEYPGTIAGVKDSSGEWSNTARMLEQFQPQGFDVFAGSETYLLQVMRGGGAGCISATANVNPGPIAALGRSASCARRRSRHLRGLRDDSGTEIGYRALQRNTRVDHLAPAAGRVERVAARGVDGQARCSRLHDAGPGRGNGGVDRQ